MKYIQELKTGMKYFFQMPKELDKKEKTEKLIYDNYTEIILAREKLKEIVHPKEKFDAWFGSEPKCKIFEDLEDETLPGFLWTGYEIESINMIVMSVRKIGSDKEIFKTITPSASWWPPMIDRRFGLEDEEVNSLLYTISNMPDNYRAMLYEE